MKIYNRAFTLIELLVVVLIIAILVAVALPQYQRAVTRSKFYRLIPPTNALKDAQELYYNTHGTYADAFDKLDVQLPTMPGVTFSIHKNGSHFIGINAMLTNTFGYRVVLDHATGGVVKSSWKGKGFCIDYSLAKDTTCTFVLGMTNTEHVNWYKDWHMLH